MNLNLQRPLVFFDLETTGTDIAKDRIVEISILKVYPDAKEELHTYLLNPGIPIPLEASKIHGIYDEDVKGKPSFSDLLSELAPLFEDVDVAGYNSNKFDIPLLVEEFLRAGYEIDFSKMRSIDVQTIFHKMEKRTLSAAYRFYCGKELTNAHTSAADTKATYEVLKGQLDRYPELRNEVADLAAFTRLRSTVDFAGRLLYDEDGEEVVNFGKYKGKKLRDVFKADPAYLDWVERGDFALDTKRAFRLAKERYTSHPKQRVENGGSDPDVYEQTGMF